MENGLNERTALIQNEDTQHFNEILHTHSRGTSVEPESPGCFWKNHLVLCFSFLLSFTSYLGIQNLESTLNHISGLGVSSLACVSGGVVMAALFAPAFVYKVGPKWSAATGLGGQVIFASANFYPQFYMLIPASLILGVASAIQWTGTNVYLTQLASDYADRILDEQDNMISRFNGIFFMFVTGAQVVGNLISSLVLFDKSNQSSVTNITHCGALFCHFNSTDERHFIRRKNSWFILVPMGIYTACTIASFVLFSAFADIQTTMEQWRAQKLQNHWQLQHI